MGGIFNKNLEKLDFKPSDENRSLLFVSELETNKELTPAEVFGLEDAKEFEATAVYFRRFPKGRSPIPQIYIYDDTKNNLNDTKLAEIHRDLWSFCRIPMFIIIEKTDVKIFDARKPVNVLKNGEIKTSPIVPPINTASDAVNLYSQKLFDSGIFWEREQLEGRFLESTSAYHDLIKNLKTVREKFLKIANLPEETANKLLVYSILIKYLEERGNQEEKDSIESDKKGLFAKNFFRENFEAEDFCEVIRKGKIIKLFDRLSEHFNGKIFKWLKVEERKQVQETDLKELAYFLDGNSNLESGQLFFDWRKYSFNYLPVELISSVYEVFLKEEKTAVYTPEFLVNTLIDESMPQMEFEKTSVKTIDVSCGSGIFLVAAFKRLAQRHRYAEFRKSGKLIHLKSDKLLEIIKENIFGVDIEEDAVHLTVFSLCLALCDQLKPQEIWQKLKFDETFEDNFKPQNFFDYLETDKEKLGTFDLVIGNAPFAELGIKKDDGEIYYYLDKNNKKVRLNLEISKKLDAKKNIFPRNQIALMFLDQSPQLLKENGFLCLIMPAAPLLYNNTAEFKKDFFPKHQVFQILDFTNLDSILFGTAKVPAAAIFVKKQTHDEERPITHIIIRRTTTVEERIFFEIDKYDFHYVSQSDALNNEYVWKCNLLGGGRLTNLIQRLSEMGTIESFTKKKKWNVGEGYKVYKGRGKDQSAEYITGKRTIPAQAFGTTKVDENKIKIETAELFERPRKKEIYMSPLLIVRKNNSGEKILTYFSDENLRYNESLFGISAPNEKDSLLKLAESFETFKHLYKLFITATSSEFAVGRATSLLKKDIMNLPYSEDKDEMKLSYVEQIICDDVLNYQIEMLSKGSAAEANWKKALKGDLEKFGEVFSKALNSVYEETDKAFFLKKIYDWGAFYITEFNYGKKTREVEKQVIDELPDAIESLVKTKYRPNIYLIKILKLYERNKVYLIKPKTLRYWLRSIAIKDADEVFADSIKAEANY